ncbi:MAG: ribose-phosphate diphosphokinase [Armatimonadetes bacterium]|nr:ribose-phosphate diphosphokinase [Armatimonadota bacterium]
MSKSTLLVFSTRSYEYLRNAVCRWGGFDIGQVERKTFPDFELYQRVLTPPFGRKAALIGGTISEADTLELFDLGCALARMGAQCLTIVIPYFGYSTMERPVKPGEVVVAKNRARLLSCIPPAGSSNRVVLLDLHTEGLPFYFEGDARPIHLYAKPVVLQAVAELGGADFVLACTDAGRAKWVESLANDLGVPASFLFKRRVGDVQVEVTAVEAHVEGRRVVIYDDMIRTGTSLLRAGRAYKDAGAASLAAVATHGVLPGDSLERLRNSGLFDAVVCTDTHPRTSQLDDGFLQVRSVAELIGIYLEETS